MSYCPNCGGDDCYQCRPEEYEDDEPELSDEQRAALEAERAAKAAAFQAWAQKVRDQVQIHEAAGWPLPPELERDLLSVEHHEEMARICTIPDRALRLEATPAKLTGLLASLQTNIYNAKEAIL